MQSAPLNFRRAIIWLGRIVLGGIFIYAGYSKLFQPNLMTQTFFMLKFSVLSNLSNFGQQVRSYHMLSENGVWFVSHFLPPFEIALGLLLLIGWQLRIWASIVTAILVDHAALAFGLFGEEHFFDDFGERRGVAFDGPGERVAAKGAEAN